MSYRCLVCGYDQMPYPPQDYNICPCCGTEYGVDDVFESHYELRNQWLSMGGHWFSRVRPYIRPPYWNAWDQLDLAGYHYSVHRPVSTVTKESNSVPRPNGLRVFAITRRVA